MSRIDFMPRHYRDKSGARTFRAVLASCLFHGLLFGSVVSLGLLYRSQVTPIKSGSAPGAPAISLATMVIVPPPPQTAPPLPTPRIPLSVTTAPTPFSSPSIQPKFPEEGIPVLATQPTKAARSNPAKVHTTLRPSDPSVAISPSLSRPAPASSYSPGPNILSHPPYPEEARNLHETGVVVMNVQFDAQGDVARAEVSQSSGVPLLDSETRSFIRAHWHSATYAGQTIRQPVEYSLEKL